MAKNNAGVTVVIVGVSFDSGGLPRLFEDSGYDKPIERTVSFINAYLVPGPNLIVGKKSKPLSELPEMTRGNSPTDGGYLLLAASELPELQLDHNDVKKYIRPFVGASELTASLDRLCIWIDDSELPNAQNIPAFAERFEKVRGFRSESTKAATVKAADWPHRFDERKELDPNRKFVIPIRSSGRRYYIPMGIRNGDAVIANTCFELRDRAAWPFALLCSRLHVTWIDTICAKMREDYSYTNTLGWNTFPVPTLTEKNKGDLTRCAEDILLAREHYFPATIADMYDPDRMDEEFPLVREAHERNDEVLERIYIGRRFKNDTERLEKLFELYTKMTKKGAA